MASVPCFGYLPVVTKSKPVNVSKVGKYSKPRTTPSQKRGSHKGFSKLWSLLESTRDRYKPKWETWLKNKTRKKNTETGKDRIE